MKTFSAFNDDGITITVMADSEKQAIEKTAQKIAEIGFEVEPDFFEDDIDDSFVSDDETVSEWLVKNGANLNKNNMLIMEWNDIEQDVQVVNL